MTQAHELNAANIILQQLGGARFLNGTIGAKDIFSDNDGMALVFKFMRGAKNKATYVKIQLDVTDTYTVTFSKITRKKDKQMGIYLSDVKTVSVHEMVYADQLHAVFQEETGLSLIAPRIFRV